MSYLRTNKQVGKELDADAIGKGVAQWMAGSLINPLNGGGKRFYGGLVMFSISDTNSVPLSIATVSVLASHYGVTFVSNVLGGGAGYRVVPIFINVASELSMPYRYAPVYTISANDSTVLVDAYKLSLSMDGEIFLNSLPSTRIHHIVVTGLIISTPFGPWG